MTNEEAINQLKDMQSRCTNGYDAEAINNAIKALETKRPTGEWIIDGHHIRCNRCNKYICNTDREGDVIPDNFCPNCGAKMKEAEDDS